MSSEVEKWYNKVTGNNSLFLLKGEVSEDLIAQSLEVVERQFNNSKISIRKKIYNVLVECLQNLHHHSASAPQADNSEFGGKVGVCVLSQEEGKYHVTTGNYVAPKQYDFLTQHLNKINSLDENGLKDMYKEILDNQTFSEKGGGGLGMVDIARKSGNKLNFDFIDCGNNFYFFTLDITFC